MATSEIRGASAPVAAAGAAGGIHQGEVGWRWLTLSPSVIVFALLTILPLANMLFMSFHNVGWAEGAMVLQPVGLRNYTDIPADNLFVAGIMNTIIFVAVATTAEMILGFGLAVLCSRITRGKTLYRAIFILPILIPGIVIGAIWKLMYNFDFGIINQLTGLIGIPPQDWLGQYETALLSVIIVDIWHWTPFCFLLLLASIEGLPQDVYEAAKIDGASGWQELFSITLPMMWPAIAVTFVFRM
ncbi:MAG: sugar ABC transporter permease, partial [Pseudomonadota bacterium]